MPDERGDVRASLGSQPYWSPIAAWLKRWRRSFAMIGGAGLLCAIAFGAALVSQAYAVQRELIAGGDHVDQARDAALADDYDTARAELAAAQTSARTARDSASSRTWSLGARVPHYGRSLGAIRAVAADLDDLVHLSLPALVDAAPLLRADRSPDLRALAAVAPPLRAASSTASITDAEWGNLLQQSLLPAVTSAVTELRSRLAPVVATVGRAADVAELAPGMAGVDGPRRYAVVVTSGGGPMYAVVTADAGTLAVSPIGPTDPRVGSSFDGEITTDAATLRDITEAGAPPALLVRALADRRLTLRSGRPAEQEILDRLTVQ